MPTPTTAKPLISPRPARAAPLRVSKPRPAARPQPLVLSVVDIIGTKFCVVSKDGKKVFNLIHRAFKKQQPVEVSFRGAELLTFPFVHAVIGSLYEKYDEKQIRPLLKVTGLDKDGEIDLEHAIREAKKYFADPKGYIALRKRIYKEMCDEGYYS